MKTSVHTTLGAQPSGAYSQGIRAANLVFVSGQSPRDPATGAVVGDTIEEQTQQALANVEAILREAGCELADLVKVTTFLQDLSQFDGYDAVYRARMPDPKPARTTVEAGLGGELIELDAVAVIPSGA